MENDRGVLGVPYQPPHKRQDNTGCRTRGFHQFEDDNVRGRGDTGLAWFLQLLEDFVAYRPSFAGGIVPRTLLCRGLRLGYRDFLRLL